MTPLASETVPLKLPRFDCAATTIANAQTAKRLRTDLFMGAPPKSLLIVIRSQSTRLCSTTLEIRVVPLMEQMCRVVGSTNFRRRNRHAVEVSKTLDREFLLKRMRVGRMTWAIWILAVKFWSIRIRE